MSDLVLNDPARSAVLDPAHLGDIEGALGTIRKGDLAIAARGVRGCARSP